MTLENLLSQVGMGTKQLTDRYSEYGAPVPDQSVYYAYEPQSAAPAASPKHHHHISSGGLKSNASMSALTLLAFLFFLHILQQCIKEHMTEMTTTPVMVMSAGRDGEVDVSKSDKIDRTGFTQTDRKRNQIKSKLEDNPLRQEIGTDDKMMRINAAEHRPRTDFEYVYKHADKTAVPGFVSAMDEE